MSSFRSDLEAYLVMCDRHIAQGHASIARQRAAIQILPKDARTTNMADRLLLCLLDSQRLHEDHREQLLTMIDTAVD